MKSQLHLLGDFYRRELGHYLLITAVAFLLLIGLSLAVGLFRPELARSVMDFFSTAVQELDVVDAEGNFSAPALFFNNFRAMTMGILCGFIPFIYLTALSLGVNSMLLGFFAAVYLNEGISMVRYFAALIPHGIFELPAMILAFACGVYLCHTVSDFVKNNEKGIVKQAVMDILRVLLLNILPLLICAAAMEAYVTPRLVELL